jgi:hypothetical protein
MGGTGNSIGDFNLYMHDSEYDHVKDGQPKEYYENYKVNCTFSQLLPGFKEENPWVVERNKNEWEIEVPLLKFGTIHKLRKNYRFEWGDNNWRKIMWEEITKRGFVVEGYIAIGGYYHEGGKTIFRYYYLTSKIGEEPVYLQSPTEGVDILQRVTCVEDEEWIIRKGLEFYTEIRT